MEVATAAAATAAPPQPQQQPVHTVAQPRQPTPDDQHVPRRVYVGGLPFAASEEELRAVWGECGAVEALDMLTFADSGKFKGIAFITFATVRTCGYN